MAANVKEPLFGKRPGVDTAPGKRKNARPSDKRRADRVIGFKNGKLILPNGPAADCIVRNYSEYGCLITFVGAELLPETLSIRMDLLSPPQPARVVWRDQGVAGLEFV